MVGLHVSQPDIGDHLLAHRVGAAFQGLKWAAPADHGGQLGYPGFVSFKELQNQLFPVVKLIQGAFERREIFGGVPDDLHLQGLLVQVQRDFG